MQNSIFKTISSAAALCLATGSAFAMCVPDPVVDIAHPQRGEVSAADHAERLARSKVGAFALFQGKVYSDTTGATATSAIVVPDACVRGRP